MNKTIYKPGARGSLLQWFLLLILALCANEIQADSYYTPLVDYYDGVSQTFTRTFSQGNRSFRVTYKNLKNYSNVRLMTENGSKFIIVDSNNTMTYLVQEAGGTWSYSINNDSYPKTIGYLISASTLIKNYYK